MAGQPISLVIQSNPTGQPVREIPPGGGRRWLPPKILMTCIASSNGPAGYVDLVPSDRHFPRGQGEKWHPPNPTPVGADQVPRLLPLPDEPGGMDHTVPVFDRFRYPGGHTPASPAIRGCGDGEH